MSTETKMVVDPTTGEKYLIELRKQYAQPNRKLCYGRLHSLIGNYATEEGKKAAQPNRLCSGKRKKGRHSLTGYATYATEAICTA